MSQGFKGDLKVLEAVCLDVAQAAYRTSEPEIGPASWRSPQRFMLAQR